MVAFASIEHRKIGIGYLLNQRLPRTEEDEAALLRGDINNVKWSLPEGVDPPKKPQQSPHRFVHHASCKQFHVLMMGARPTEGSDIRSLKWSPLHTDANGMECIIGQEHYAQFQHYDVKVVHVNDMRMLFKLNPDGTLPYDKAERLRRTYTRGALYCKTPYDSRSLTEKYHDHPSFYSFHHEAIIHLHNEAQLVRRSSNKATRPNAPPLLERWDTNASMTRMRKSYGFEYKYVNPDWARFELPTPLSIFPLGMWHGWYGLSNEAAISDLSDDNKNNWGMITLPIPLSVIGRINKELKKGRIYGVTIPVVPRAHTNTPLVRQGRSKLCAAIQQQIPQRPKISIEQSYLLEEEYLAMQDLHTRQTEREKNEQFHVRNALATLQQVATNFNARQRDSHF
jgi:hypothetical protein